MRIKKLVKFGGLVTAGLVALLVGHSHYAFSEVDGGNTQTQAQCTSIDYADYLEAQNSKAIEMTPANALSLSEAFIEKCPERPEIARVALSAAREALDAGYAQAAATHFQTALAHQASFDQQTRMDFIITLLANGRDELAWQMRDEEVALWLNTLEADGLAQISARHFTNGVIYTLSFEEIDPMRRERLVWVAVPKGPGLLASMSLSSEVQLVALARLRVGAAAVNLQQVVFNRCEGRDALSTTFSGYEEDDISKLANGMLTDYLAAPDMLTTSDDGQPILTCFETERVLVAPDPSISIPAY